MTTPMLYTDSSYNSTAQKDMQLGASYVDKRFTDKTLKDNIPNCGSMMVGNRYKATTM